MSSNGACSSSPDDISTNSGKEASTEGTMPKDKAMDSDKTAGDASGSGLPSKHRCSKCNYSTRNKILYDNHSCDQHDEDSHLEEQTLITLKVDEGKKFHCSECDVWAQGHAFEEHLMCHIILKPYQCLYCSQCFVNRRDIGRHVVKEHVGMKMNCALRALKRAKGLMKATLESGSFQFYACVPGKVPLPGDPEKSKAKKKSKSDADASGSKDTSKSSSEGTGPGNEVSSVKDPSSNGQDNAASLGSGSVSSDCSTAKSPSDASVSYKASEDLKDLGSGMATEGESHHKGDSSPSITGSGLSEETEESDQKAALSAEPEVSHSDAGSEVKTSSAETADQTDGNNKMAECEEKKEKVDSTLNTVNATNSASKPNEQNSDIKPCEASTPSNSDEKQTSTSNELNSSLKSENVDELDIKANDTMDTDCKKDTAIIRGAEAADSTTKEENTMKSDTKSEETTDSADKTDKSEDSSFNIPKTDSCTDLDSKVGASGETAREDKVENSIQALQNSDSTLELETLADKLTDSTDETETTAGCTSLDETMNFTPTVQERTPPATETEEAAESSTDKTVVSETTMEEQKSMSSPMETDEPVDISPTFPNSVDEVDKTEQSKIADTEDMDQEPVETNMETENSSVFSKEKNPTEDENENSQNSMKAKSEGDENNDASKESSDKTSISQDVGNNDSMEVEESENISEKNETIITNIDATESENKIKVSSDTKPDSAPVEASNDPPQEDCKEPSTGEDADFPSSNFDQSEEEESEMGLKIVAAFSLQGDGAKDSNDSDSQTTDVKARSEKESSPEADASPKESTAQEVAEAVPSSSVSETSSIPRTLGPPSKPVPSSSFLGITPSAEAITSQGAASRQVPVKNCYFFVCGFSCSFSCLTSPEFRDHLMLDHAGESSFRCFHCGFQSPSEDGLVRHISAHAHTYSKSVPLYICGASACKFGSNLVNDFITHQSAWHPELTAFHCHDCDERFDSIEELLQHFEANFLHIINCPHCTAKTTERRTLLNHISAAHPGKPKMVSVAKQIVCRDRKLNNYAQFMQAQNQTTTVVSAIPSGTEQSGASHSRTKSLVSILTQPIQPQERELTRQAQEREQTRQTTSSSAPNVPSVKVESVDDDDEDFFQETFDDSFDEEEYGIQGQSQASAIAYMGSKPDDREIDNFKCQFCTFIARDRCRLDGHERCHGLPPSRKSRFKCMYCPQGFNNEHKFSSHVSCHPGLIKFSLYCCKYCDFDSNQRHIIIKHVRSTRDQVHMITETNEENMYAVLNKSMESRVLECNQCSYMTRHRKHLVAHLKREHSNLRKTGITVDCDIVEKYPTQSIGANRNKALEMALSHDHAAQLPVGDDVYVRENQARRFKCPICQYLVPRAADLKAHVKRHSEIGEITLVMFRCKYCSAASTAREIIYGHLMEKHLGKQIALVKRIVTIDTKGNDNGYAVTSMEDEDRQEETQSFPEGGDSNPGLSSKAVLVIPDSAGETLTALMQCPSCAFGSYSRKTILQHVSNHHPEVKIMGQRQDGELYPLETTYTAPPASAAAAARFTLGESLKGEILIVPDSQTFDEAVLCPKCDYATIHRRNIVLHLEQNHPEVSVMGRNDYPTFDGKGQAAVEANATGKDGMVIIGSGSLDEKIRCLYENYGDRMKCMICQTERPKKFFIHVHILRHLNILLWGCQFCSHKGLQKYKMMDHIKKVHPGRAFCIRYLPVNVEERVNQYLQNASMIRARRSGEEGDSLTPPKSSSVSASSGGDSDLNALRMKYKTSQDRLSGCTIGSEELDMKLACLYSIGSDNRYRCVVCAQEFQRKFAVHRHIVQSHLKVNLIGCRYCDLEGVERHIMMDHIIETHKNAPISMRNLAQNLENKVAEFLNRMTLAADDALELPVSDLGMDGEFKLPEPPQMTLTQALSPQRSTPPRTPSPSTSSGGKNQLNPNLLLLGRDILHRHLACMIREVGSSFCCQVCKWDFPRKYAVHRHILMKHLKVGIIGCPYCSFEGVERYQVFTHIREEHKEAELSLRYLSVDLESHVAEYMNGLANGTLDMYSKATPPWSMKKVPKKEVVSDEDSQDTPPMTFEEGQGLVVAMFGGKKSGISIKEEPRDDDDDALGQEPMDREVNSDEGSINYDRYIGNLENDVDREVSSTSLMAANGTKAKVATDVQTNIRVITIKEKGFKRHICEKCKFTSLHRSNIVRHIYRVHEQYREHECPVCNYKTLSRVLIEQHVTSEHPGVPVPEIVGSKGIKRKIEMSREELEYDSMKKCKAAATSKRREADLPLLNSTSTQLYACAYCNFETMTHAQIVQHTREKHSLAEPMRSQEEEGEGGTSQQGDGQEDSAFENAVNTVKMNQEDMSSGHEDCLWQCFYCSFKTPTEEDLKIHFAETHPGNIYRAKRVPAWRFVCRSCHVKTRAHSKMRYHLNRHINYRPYTCTTCGSFYPSPDQCRKHCRANNHNETFTYVKVPRKERRLQELLKECQEIAIAMARNPAAAEATLSSATLSQPIPSKRKAKKSFSAHSRMTPAKMRKNYEYDAPYSPRGGSSQSGHRDDRPKEDTSIMVCASCDFSAQNVCDVWLHFIKEHEEQEFRWLDSSTGYICTETGEITNAKDVPPDLEAPPGPGYTVMSSRLLNCEHCEFTTSTVQAMKSHLRRHLPKRYLCPYCSLRCSRRDTITQHVRCGHKGRELWTIFFRLPEGFVADSDNAESNLESGGPGGSSVGEDGQSSTSAGGAVPSQERIRCGQCDLRLPSVFTVLQHHRADHAELDFLWMDLTNGYTCNQSGEVTDAKQQSPHLFTQDGYTKEADGSNVVTYCCKFCPFTSAFVQAIKSHMKSHLPHGFMCPYCCMTSNSKEKMTSHQSCMHREQDPWILHLRMPSDSSSLAGSSVVPEASDLSVTHHPKGVTQYSCNECDYTSENLYQYRLHLANHGSFPHLVKDIPDDLPFRCGYCVYVAEDEGDFGAHIASHLERRNFRCSKCEYTAFKRSAVQTHIQTTHDETEEIEVIDLQAHNVSEQGGSVEEPQLVNLEPKVKVIPVNDLDLDREGLTLFSPPSTPDEEGQEARLEGQDVNIIGLETPSMAELDNQSDSTEEWGGNEEDVSREGSPAPSDHATTPPRTGNSILRLTLQGKLTGEYGIKRAVPVNKDGDLSEASGSHDSSLSAPSDAEDDPFPGAAHEDEDHSLEQPDDAEMENEQYEVEEDVQNDDSEIKDDDDSADVPNEEDENVDMENDDEEQAEMENEEDDMDDLDNEEDQSLDQAESSVGFEPLEGEADEEDGGGERSEDEGMEEEEERGQEADNVFTALNSWLGQ